MCRQYLPPHRAPISRAREPAVKARKMDPFARFYPAAGLVPGAKGIKADVEQIGFGTMRKTALLSSAWAYSHDWQRLPVTLSKLGKRF